MDDPRVGAGRDRVRVLEVRRLHLLLEPLDDQVRVEEGRRGHFAASTTVGKLRRRRVQIPHEEGRRRREGVRVPHRSLSAC